MKFINLAILGFIIGVFAGENHRGKGPFFTSWYGNDLYYGEHVKYKKIDHFYSDCKKITIIGLQVVDNSNLAWVLLEGCPWTTERFYTDILDQSNLEQK